MSSLLQDIRISVRTLRKTPVFAFVAMISLALGIGANTAIFTLMDQVLLRLLPVHKPEQLVLLNGNGGNIGHSRGPNAFSYAMYQDLRDKNSVFSGVLARYSSPVTLTYKGVTERANCELVSGNYFDVLGVRARLGRTISPEDDRTPGSHPLVMISFNYWQRRFGGSHELLNEKLIINGHPMTVIGVAAAGFGGTEIGDPPDLFVPMMMKAQVTPTWSDLDNRRSMWLNIFGRLKDGVSRSQAQANLQVLYKQLRHGELSTLPPMVTEFGRKRFLAGTIEVLPAQTGRSQLRKDFQTPLVVLMGMVGLVLLIACANVANLLIARGAARQRDIAIRLSLGASRGDITRQILIESMLLAVAGGMLAVLVAVWTGDFLLAFLPFENARIAFSTAPDPRTLTFNFTAALLAGLLFGLVPAWQLARNSSVAATLKDEAANVSGSSGSVRFRKGLVVAQIALSLLLLVGAGLFSRSLYNLRSLSPGFRVTGITSFSIDSTLNGYSTERTLSLYAELLSRIQGLPGVQSVTYTDIGLMSGDRASATVRIEGYHPKDGEDMNPDVSSVGPGYFATLGVPVLAGREFNDADRAGSPKVGLINESMAKRYFGTESPLGKHFGFGRDEKPLIEIVGVVRDGRRSLREEAPRWIYVPFSQGEEPAQATFYVRSALPPPDVAQTVRREVRNVEPNLPVFNMKSLEQQVDEHLFTDRAIALLSALFGLLATSLAAVGLYGVIAYMVARRTREIGIRVALGAERNSVLWLVLKEVLVLATIGIALGLPISMALGRVVRSQLFGLQPSDPLTVLCATLILSTVAMLAGYLPASRATRIDPLLALRYE